MISDRSSSAVKWVARVFALVWLAFGLFVVVQPTHATWGDGTNSCGNLITGNDIEDCDPERDILRWIALGSFAASGTIVALDRFRRDRRRDTTFETSDHAAGSPYRHILGAVACLAYPVVLGLQAWSATDGEYVGWQDGWVEPNHTYTQAGGGVLTAAACAFLVAPLPAV